MNAEQQRLAQNDQRAERWHLWGPYLSERQWGTVREDYSANGDAWNYFPHEQARSRAYRWGEDGIGGICDYKQRLCFAFAFWNGRDSILKERLFGLTGPEGNHGEDVKEIFFFEENTPTHSYMRMTYRYSQSPFPYQELVRQNSARSRMEPEFELCDTGLLRENRFFDITIEYAKATEDDILIRATARNCGPETAALHLLPTLWFRNTWSWAADSPRPNLRVGSGHSDMLAVIEASHADLGDYRLFCDEAGALLFTENETNQSRLFGVPNELPFVKDAFHDAIVSGNWAAVNPQRLGTKAAADYAMKIATGAARSVRLRLQRISGSRAEPFADFDEILARRSQETDEFYRDLAPKDLSPERCAIQR
ncbi:MAG TPA: hypothetical protein VGF73_09585, partial [Chthoniobacterales bacterium]